MAGSGLPCLLIQAKLNRAESQTRRYKSRYSQRKGIDSSFTGSLAGSLCLAGWLDGSMAGFGWLAGLLDVWLAGWIDGWITFSKVGCLFGWLAGCLWLAVG